MIRLVLRVLVARGCGGRRPTLTVTGFDRGRNARPAPKILIGPVVWVRSKFLVYGELNPHGGGCASYGRSRVLNDIDRSRAHVCYSVPNGTRVTVPAEVEFRHEIVARTIETFAFFVPPGAATTSDLPESALPLRVLANSDDSLDFVYI